MANTLKEHNIRVDIDTSDEGFGKKVRAAKVEKIPYWLVIGDKELEVKKATLESRDKGQLGQFDINHLLTQFTTEIKDRK
jgi:threonyl-tRNA synthetase